MRIIREVLQPGMDEVLFDGESGQVVVELSDGTRLRVQETRSNNGRPVYYLDVNLETGTMSVLPRAANVVWVGRG